MMHGAAGGRLTDGEVVANELQDGRLVDVADDVVRAVGVVRVVVGIAGRPDRALGRVVHRAALCNDHTLASPAMGHWGTCPPLELGHVKKIWQFLR